MKKWRFIESGGLCDHSDTFPLLRYIIFEVYEKTENWKKIFIFLGKTGENELHEASKSWDIKYKQRVSITNSDSIILEIYNIRKK